MLYFRDPFCLFCCCIVFGCNADSFNIFFLSFIIGAIKFNEYVIKI